MSDDEPGDELMPKVFAVDDDLEDFDLDLPPTSGQEYLRRVQIEAQTVPSVVTVKIHENKIKQKSLSALRHHSTVLAAPAGYAPDLPWQNMQCGRFAQIRQKVTHFKTLLKKEQQKPLVRLPLKNDVDRWCELCFGKYGSADENERGSPPLLSIVGHMDQPTILQVLEYHVNWLNATGFSSRQGQWFYALMACIEKPLLPDACSLLRILAKSSATLRASLDTVDDPLLPQLNLIICLIARYFEQIDLADPGT